ncbi:MAG: SNF2 helicase associated domain-containing protein [Cellulosilyticaceae bacterium]
MITIQRVQSLASSSSVYDRAVKLLRKGSIGHYHVASREGGTQVIEAEVMGSRGDYYSVEIEIDPTGRVTWGCECPAHFEYDGICKHGTAVLLKYCLEQQRSRGGVEQQLEEQVYTSPYTKMMLDYYENDTIREIYNRHAHGEMRLYPKLYHLYHNTFAVGFKIGATKPYIVKNVNELVENIIQEKNASYGKNLEFVHCKDSFAEDNWPMVRFVVDTITAQEALLSEMDIYGKNRKNKKLLTLNGKDFDAFFDLVENQELEFEDSSGKERMIRLVKANPEIEFEMTQKAKQFELRHNLGDYEMVKMPYHYYFVTFDQLYRCDEAFGQNVFPMLHYMNYEGRVRGDERLVLKETEIQKFTATVLPRVRRGAKVRVDEEVVEAYTPEPLQLKTYFDLDDVGNIVGEVVFEYGEVQIKPYEGPAPKEAAQLVRDIAKEETLNFILNHYDFKVKKGKIHLEDEDKIYEFLLKGIDELLTIGEVNASERLKGRRIIQRPTGSIGIRIASNLLELNFNELQMHVDEIDAILGAYRTRSKYYRLKSGAFLDLENEEMGQIAHLIEGLGIEGKDLVDGVVTVPKHRAIYIDNILKESGQIEANRDKPFKQLIREIKNVEDTDYEVPESLKKTLRNYQKTGYRWLKAMTHYGFGGILADDMGLGKTLQVITLLQAEKEERSEEDALPSLIVVPTSLTVNWQKEFQKFAPLMRVGVLLGDAATRQSILEHIEEFEVIITSYDTLKRDIESYMALKFRYCIADEAHYIKNANTQNAKALKLIQSDFRLALTGTPMENSLAELWSIFDFVMPGYLFTYTYFKKHFEAPIVKEESQEATVRLQKMIAPFVLRRLKRDVLKELPSKTEVVMYNAMEEEQERIYRAHLAQMQQDFEGEVKGQGIGKSHIKILAMITRLRQICCHPNLYLEGYKGESGKLNQCMELISESTGAGHKILVFSQFTSMLDLLGTRLQEEGVPYYMLTGSTKAEKRMELVEAFNSDQTPVFLISLKAGGTGLNLTGADIVIHYDPWWNVSSQNQATDRAYRIGQKNKVQVFKLITEGTIEEKIEKLQQRKLALTENVLKEGETFITSMSEDEIRDLFQP